MTRLLSISALLLTATTVPAQQLSPLASTTPDSLNTALLRAGTVPPFSTIQPALSRVAGVQYTPFSGAPGAWATVRIRGIANVTGNSQPLYVVDGVPVYNLDSTPEQWGAPGAFSSGQGPSSPITPFSPVSNPLLDMPVEDVAQIEVVQGAAATARYGAQGTNGAILISTRRGADGGMVGQAPRVRYAGWGGVQQVRRRYELLGARQYADLANVTAATNGHPALFSAADLSNLGEVDWQDEVFRTAGIQSHNLSLDGLTAKNTRYYVAADYLRQTGVVMNSRLSRYSLRANVEQQLGSRLTVGLQLAGSQLDQRQPGYEPDAGPQLRELLLAPPAVSARRTSPTSFDADQLRYLMDAGHSPRTRRLLTQLHATYQLTPALTLRLRGGLERTATHDEFLADYTTGPPPDGRRYLQQGTATADLTSWVTGAELLYQRTVQERHILTASLCYLRQQHERKTSSATLQTISGGNGGSSSISSTDYTSRLKAYPTHTPTAAFTYVYAGRYEVQASLRADKVVNSLGQLIFSGGLGFPEPPDVTYRLFPGGEVRWHLGKEGFLENVPGLRTLTLQAGAGRTSSYFTLARTTHFDAGLHLEAFGGKLTLDASAYQRRTRHAETALVFSTPQSSGSSSRSVYPDITLLNQGLALTLGSTWQVGALAGSSQLAAATNHNEVEDIEDPFQFNLVSRALKVGQPVGSFYVGEQDGTYPAGSPNAGQRRFRDRNNDGRVDFNDNYYQGQGLPRYTLNLYQQLRLKRFQLAAQVDGLFGYQLLNNTLVLLDTPTGNYNSSVRALNYWTPANQNTSVPKPGSYPSFPLSNQALESGSNVRLSQLTLSYEVLNTGTRKASVWVGGQNLFVTGPYRGFDPNVSGGGAAPLFSGQDTSVYPVARVWQVGVRGQF